VGDASDATTAVPAAPGRPRRRRSLAVDLSILGVIGVLLVGAVAVGGIALYRQLYSPSAFVLRYLELLADGRAADALALPGVAVDSAVLEEKGLPADASDALLRQAALGSLRDIEAVGEQTSGDVTRVTVSYTAGGYPAQTTFAVRRDGQIGVAPTWRFDSSPLAIMNLAVLGSTEFEVNGFPIDKRQVSATAIDDPAAPVPLLVLSPGLYSVRVDTAVSTAPGVAVLADAPLTSVPVDVQAEPTPEFVSTVQERVDEFLNACAQQQVLQPTGCPFGRVVNNRIEGLPTWSIVQLPTVTIAPDGGSWRIPAVAAVAHIEVDIRSLSTGAVRHVSEDVPFLMDGTITTLPDGSLSIQLGVADG
jgi:hypothetical protein